jgi:2-methylcitrate dehydratase
VTYGALSSAMVAGVLMDLTPTQLAHALALAATPNVAMRQTRVGELSHWKGCAFANAARNGVFAAQLARLGMTGPSDIFEGEMGFFQQVSGPFTLPVLPQEAPDGPNHWMINQTYIKHYPAEYHSQSAIEAVLLLRAQLLSQTQLPLEQLLAQITHITIDSFDAAVDIIAGFPEHWAPTSRETADHSMPYCVAAALTDGDITLASFSDTRLQDPVLRQLIQTVTVNRHAEMTAGYPEGIPNRLTITMSNGSSVSHLVRYPLGHARNPMQDTDVIAKFKGLANGTGLTHLAINAIISEVMALDTATTLMPLLQQFATTH